MTYEPLIYMRNVPGKPNHRALTAPLPCRRFDGSLGVVPSGFEWDGSSVPWIFQRIFPRHRHPIASCRHDWRCLGALSARERAWADREFRLDAKQTTWEEGRIRQALTWAQAWIGYLGVRIGAFLGLGVRYPHWTDRRTA